MTLDPRRLLLVMLVVLGIAFLGAIVLNAAPPRAALPALPDSIPSQLGWVKVHRVANLKCGPDAAYGCFEYATRTLSIADSLTPSLAWMALEHERIHMILFDADTHPRSMAEEDHLADVIAAARVTERLAQTAP